MPIIYILHGYACGPDSFCIPRLKQQLEICGYQVITPAFPHPDQVDPDDKAARLADHYQFTSTDIIISISMGSIIGLKLLEYHDISIGHFISVGGAYEFEMNELKRTAPRFENYRNYLNTHGQPSRDRDAIRSKSQYFYMIICENDKTVSNRNSQKLAQVLQCDTHIITTQKDHFRGIEEPLLLGKILECI